MTTTERSEGLRAIAGLQQAYGFQTEQPLWDPTTLFDAFALAYPGIDEIRGLHPGNLKHVMHTWTIGETRVSAGMHSAIYVRAQTQGAITLTIQYSGTCEVTQDGVKMVLNPLSDAILLVDAPAWAQTGDVSSIAIEVSPPRVTDTARSMLGMESPVINLYPRAVPLSTPEMQRYVRNLPHLLGALRDYPRIAQDALDRLAVQLLVDTRGASKRPRRQAAKSVSVDLACLHMMEHMADEITLTDLERVSLLSARLLQIEFRARFGASPMTWLLHRRLERAAELLSNRNNGWTVTTAAHACGFRHLGRFAAAFCRRYGMAPSAMLRGR